MAIEAGPLDPFNHSFSILVECDTQAEIDRLWDALKEGGSVEQCGWLKDRWGLSWQIAPTCLQELMNDPDPAKVKPGHRGHAKNGQARHRAAEGCSSGLITHCFSPLETGKRLPRSISPAARLGTGGQGASALWRPSYPCCSLEDMAMRKMYDFSPLFRSSIGFDRIFNLLEYATESQTMESWPPYDIVKSGDDKYRITMAVAGFSQEDLKVTHQQNLLTVSGRRPEDNSGEYLYRGIGSGEFERRFELADYVKVTGARLDNGLLTIDLVRELPEEMKPRRIAINATPTAPALRQIEDRKQAA